MLNRMAAYCSTAERCTDDIRQKMKNKGLTPEEEQQIIDRLIREKFIDESRYCKSYINDKLKFSKWGRIKISYELQKKRIPAALREEALDAINPDQYHQMLLELLTAKKKMTRGKDTRDIYQKLFRFAASRGFESNEISQCLKQLFNNEETPDDLD